MLPLLPVNANFSSVTATTPDGTQFTTTVRSNLVIEEEDDEMDNMPEMQEA
jgi:hypothetical protein